MIYFLAHSDWILFNSRKEIANKLNGLPSDEVALVDARNSLEFVTAVYASYRQNKTIEIPIDKENKFYNSWLPD